MSNNIDDITKRFEELDIQHQTEWKKLLYKQQQDKKDLLQQFKQKTNKSSKTTSFHIVHNVLSHNKHPLQQGDTVILRTTASVGYKGDTATVTFVSKNRVNIIVHNVNDISWRKPSNLIYVDPTSNTV